MVCDAMRQDYRYRSAKSEVLSRDGGWNAVNTRLIIAEDQHPMKGVYSVQKPARAWQPIHVLDIVVWHSIFLSG